MVGLQDGAKHQQQVLPSGDLVYKAPSMSRRMLTSVRLFLSRPWRKFKKGSVLVIEVCVETLLSCISKALCNLCLFCNILLTSSNLTRPRHVHMLHGHEVSWAAGPSLICALLHQPVVLFTA